MGAKKRGRKLRMKRKRLKHLFKQAQMASKAADKWHDELVAAGHEIDYIGSFDDTCVHCGLEITDKNYNVPCLGEKK